MISRAWLSVVVCWMSLSALATMQSATPAGATGTLTALDYYEIEQLYARYSHAYDSAADNGYMYADVYTADGIFVNQEGTVRQGREQLAGVARGSSAARKGPTVMTHFVTNVAIEPAQGGASGRASLLIARPPESGPGLRAIFANGGHYTDDLVKTADGWRIKKRVYHQAHPPAATPAATATAPASSGHAASAPASRHPDSNRVRLTANDYAEIYQLYGRYGYAFDGGLDSGREWASLFTSDGFHSNASNNEWVQGPVALAEFARGALRFNRGVMSLVPLQGTSKDPTRIAHIIANIMLEPTSEGVVAKAYRMVAGVGAEGQPNVLYTAGMYFDLLVKTAEGWRYREKFYMGTDTVPDLAKRFIVPATSTTSQPVFPPASSMETAGPSAPKGPTFTAEEYADLRQLYARSSAALDTGADNGGAYARWFTADGVFTDASGAKFSGRDKIAQLAHGAATRAADTQTLLYNLKLTRTTQGATGSAYSVMTTINQAGQPITVNDGGQYHDELVKTPEGWRIKTRTFVRANPGGVAAPAPAARSQWSPG